MDAAIAAIPFPVGWVILPAFFFLSGNKSICKGPYGRTFFVIFESSSWRNDRSIRRSNFFQHQHMRQGSFFLSPPLTVVGYALQFFDTVTGIIPIGDNRKYSWTKTYSCPYGCCPCMHQITNVLLYCLLQCGSNF